MLEHSRPSVWQVVADGKAGGGTTFVLGLSQHLQDCGFQVTLVTEPGSYAAQEATQRKLPLRLFNFFTWPRGSHGHGQLQQLLAGSQADLIHFHGPRAALPGSLALGLRRPGKPHMVYTVHGYHFKKKSALPRWAGHLAEHLIQRRSDATVHVSAADGAFAQRRHFGHPARSAVILNGVVEPMTQAPTLTERQYDVVFAARLVPQKNPVFAARVLRGLADAGFKVALVGDGDLRPEVQATLGECGAVQTGALSHADSTAMLANSRVLLFPSLWEGLPLTPMEAMIGGGVVVASNIEGNNEVVQHGHTGLLVDQFDVNTYVAQTAALLKDPPRLQAMGQNGQQVARQLFSQRRCLDEYTAVYQRLLTPSTEALARSSR